MSRRHRKEDPLLRRLLPLARFLALGIPGLHAQHCARLQPAGRCASISPGLSFQFVTFPGSPGDSVYIRSACHR